MNRVYNLTESDLDQIVTSTLECEDMLNTKQCNKEDCKLCDKHTALTTLLQQFGPMDLLSLDSKMKQAKWKKYHPTKVRNSGSAGNGSVAALVLTLLLSVLSIAGTCITCMLCQ